MFYRKSVVLACSAAIVCVLGIATATTGQASGTIAAKTMYLTVNTPVGLPGVGLAAGTYIFELADPDGDPSIVRVLSRDGLHVYYMGFTELIARPAGLPVNRPISFGEARPGAPLPIAAWYPANESTGRRFIYSKTGRQLITDARN
jgi:hypothetical protein